MEQINKRLMSWASILEDEAHRQAVETSRLPFIHPHVALMPDAHWGMGATVGSVIPTLGAIIPAAVGVDIGCGMSAKRTQYTLADLPPRVQYADLRDAIERAIPLGKGGHNERVYSDMTGARLRVLRDKAEAYGFDPASYSGNWEMHLGSLGSGNHFIEVSLDEEDRVWLFLHSGSRGVGNRIAQHHIKVAKSLMEKWWITLPNPDLAYLVEGTEEFWAYVRQMRWAQDFAFDNRAEMMDRVTDAFEWWMSGYHALKHEVEPELVVNCHHNYTMQEKHFGKQVWLSRKGAIDASEGTWGLIPGSMGTRSYVVRGLGNPLSLNSSPHGAGRNFSRRKARERFTADDLKVAMGDIEYRHGEAWVDEIPAAYKDIDVVMEDAKDLVRVEAELRQIVNVKGE